MTDLAQLRQIAEAATPGKWHYIPKTFHGDDTELTAGVTAGDGTAVVCISALAEEGIENPIDALHIATFDPPTVLRLLAVAEAAATALPQAKGALLLDAMIDDNGRPYGTAVKAMDALAVMERALAALKAASDDIRS